MRSSHFYPPLKQRERVYEYLATWDPQDLQVIYEALRTYTSTRAIKTRRFSPSQAVDEFIRKHCASSYSPTKIALMQKTLYSLIPENAIEEQKFPNNASKSPFEPAVDASAMPDASLGAHPLPASAAPARPTSMSQRRLALNIPALQRRISFTPAFNLARQAEASTPITPVDQIMHTPTDPPKLSPIVTTRPSIHSHFSRPSPSSDSPGISPDVPYPFFKLNFPKMALSRELSYSRGIQNPTLHISTSFARTASDLQSPALIPSHPCTPGADPTTPGSGCSTPIVRSYA